MKWLAFLPVAMLPFYNALGSISVGTAQISPYDGFVMIDFCLWVILFLGRRRYTHLHFHRCDVLAAIWLGINVLVLLFDLSGLNKFRYLVAIPVALYFLIRFNIQTIKAFHQLLYLFFACVVIMAGLGVVEYLRTGIRIFTTAGTGVGGSMILAGGVVFGWYFMGKVRRSIRWLLILAATMLIMVAMFLTFTRGVIYGFFLFTMIAGPVFARLPKLIRIAAFALIAIGFIMPWLILDVAQEKPLSYGGTKDVDRLTDMTLIERSVFVRAEPIRLALLQFREAPLFGTGFSVYRLLQKKGLLLSHVHNSLLDVLLRTGLIGLFVFLFLLYSLMTSNLHKIKSRKEEVKLNLGIQSLIFIVVLNSYFNGLPNIVYASIFWLYGAMNVGLGAILLRTSLPQVKKYEAIISVSGNQLRRLST